MTPDETDLHFAYSLRFSLDGQTLDMQLRFDEHCTYRLLCEALDMLTKRIREEAQDGSLDIDAVERVM